VCGNNTHLAMTYHINGKSKEMWGCLSALSQNGKRRHEHGLFQGTVLALLAFGGRETLRQQ